MHNPSSTDYYSGKSPWIRDKKRFRLAMILAGVLILLAISYPGTRPLYEEALLALRIPISFPLLGGGSFSYPALIYMGVGLWTLFLVWESLNRHRLLICLAMIWLTPAIGNAVLAGYQMVIPANVYALKVDQEQANCAYQFDNGKMIGNCNVLISNRSNRDITVEQTGTLAFGSGGDLEEISFPLGKVTLGPRQTTQGSPGFSVKAPRSVDPQATGSGYASLSADGFVLEMNDGRHTRIWGK